MFKSSKTFWKEASWKSIFGASFLAIFLGFGSSMTPAVATEAPTSPKEVTGEDAVNALNGVFGRYAKERGSHAKGFCVAGSFTLSDAGAGYLRIGIQQTQPAPVIGRFSIGGGNPAASDKGRSVRGLGIRLEFEDSDILDLVMISAPVFFASTPQQFVEFLKVRTADPETGAKDPEKIAAFNAANPNVMAHLNYVSQTPPPASYASTPYFSTHAFLFGGEDEEKQAARWHFEPIDGFQGLTPEQEEEFSTDFLQDELKSRLENQAAAWTAYLQLAEEGDDVNDPTAVWSAPREKFVEVGRLDIARAIESGAADDCTGLVFDPNNLSDGINPTDDPILAIRGPAYAVSLGRRTQ
jgi:catalase